MSPSLRKLALLSADERSELGPIPPALYSVLASLRELTIRGGRLQPGQITLPNLETLALATPLTEDLLASVTTAECPRLTSLQLESLPGESIDADAAWLRPLLVRWSRERRLRHLGITEHEAGDALLDALVTTGLVQQLTSLDLSRTEVSDRGATFILENASSFEHLESLDLSENDLSSSACSALEKRFELVVDVEEQGARYDTSDD